MAVIRPSRDGRLPAYTTIGILCIFAAIATSRPEFAMIGAPFLAALVIGLRFRAPVDIEFTARADGEQIIEGDRVVCTISLGQPPSMHSALEFEPNRAFRTDDAFDRYWHQSTPALSTDVALVADDWGDHSPGQLRVRSTLAGSLLQWHGHLEVPQRVRVMPTPLRLRRLLDPAAAHATAGIHRSKLLGEGSDFAELRVYQPGDRLRDINWTASARQQRPYVCRHHPERAGEVVVMIDTFNDRQGHMSPAGREALARCARATWSLAQLHLRAQDRVGFLSQGRIGLWLPVGGGDRARYRLLDTLLALGGQAAGEHASWSLPPLRAIPPAALVVAFTPLWDSRIVPTLHQLKRAGRNVTAVVVDTRDLFIADGAPGNIPARRLWELALAQRHENLLAAGVPTVMWPADSDLSHAIATATQLQSKIGVR